jgi:hypothetical protein
MTGLLDNGGGIVITENGGGFLCSYPIFSNILLSQTPSETQDAAAMNSAFVIDNVTTGCFFEDHEMDHDPSRKTYPHVFFLSSAPPLITIQVCYQTHPFTPFVQNSNLEGFSYIIS